MMKPGSIFSSAFNLGQSLGETNIITPSPLTTAVPQLAFQCPLVAEISMIFEA
jgi:hypothetical protein